MNDSEELWLKEIFDGDEAARDEYSREVTKEMFHWEDIVLTAKVYPELEEEVKDLIEKSLGYLPHPTITIEFEPSLRSLYNLFRLEQLNEDDFFQQADKIIKLVRNKDMEPNHCEAYPDSIYQNYRKNYFPFIQRARERLTIFLGYEPELEHSLIAEMWLGNILSKEQYPLPKIITVADKKALTLISYRKILLSEGKEVANNLPLLGTYS